MSGAPVRVALLVMVVVGALGVPLLLWLAGHLPHHPDVVLFSFFGLGGLAIMLLCRRGFRALGAGLLLGVLIDFGIVAFQVALALAY